MPTHEKENENGEGKEKELTVTAGVDTTTTTGKVEEPAEEKAKTTQSGEALPGAFPMNAPHTSHNIIERIFGEEEGDAQSTAEEKKTAPEGLVQRVMASDRDTGIRSKEGLVERVLASDRDIRSKEGRVGRVLGDVRSKELSDSEVTAVIRELEGLTDPEAFSRSLTRNATADPGVLRTSLIRNTTVHGVLVMPGAFAEGPTETSSEEAQEEPASDVDVETGNLGRGESVNRGLAVAHMVGGDSIRNLQEASPFEERKTREKVVGALLVLSLLIVSSFVIWVLWMVGVVDPDGTEDMSSTLVQGNGTTGEASQPPTEEPPLIALPKFTTDAIEEGPDSPQAKAYQWLKNDTMLSTANESQLLQRFVLVAFYYATNGDDWFINDGWLDDTLHECEWQSKWQSKLPETLVNSTKGPCDEDGNYLSLIMTANGLAATSIPLEITLLTSLEYLDIAANEVEG